MQLCSEVIRVMTQTRDKHSELKRAIQIAARRPSHVHPSLQVLYAAAPEDSAVWEVQFIPNPKPWLPQKHEDLDIVQLPSQTMLLQPSAVLPEVTCM